MVKLWEQDVVQLAINVVYLCLVSLCRVPNYSKHNLFRIVLLLLHTNSR